MNVRNFREHIHLPPATGNICERYDAESGVSIPHQIVERTIFMWSLEQNPHEDAALRSTEEVLTV